MKIQTRLKTGLWLSLLLTIIMSAILMWSYEEFSITKERAELTNQMRAVGFERTSLRDEYLLLNSERARKQWHIKTDLMKNMIARADSLFTSPSDKSAIAQILHSYESTVNIFSQLEENRRQASLSRSKIITYDLENRLIGQILLKAYDLNSSIAALQKSAHAAAENSLQILISILALSFILMAIMVISNSLFINRLMTNRLARLREGTDIIGQGRLDFRFRLRPDDEFGIVATSIDHTLAKLQHSLTSIDDLANEIERRIVVESELKRVNRVYAVISHINQMLIKTDDKEQLFAEACRIAVDHGNFSMAWIGIVDYEAEVVKPVVWAGNEDGYLKDIKISIRDIPEGRGPSGISVREKRFVVCNDFAADPAVAPWKEMALARGYRSSISLPITVSETVIATFTLYAPDPSFFSAAEIDLLTEVAVNIAYAIHIIDMDNKRREAESALNKTLADLERSNKELEQFAYIASHDLQEPLRTISSYVQLLEKRYRGRLDQDANDFINFIVDGAGRMQKMINDLLEYSRVSTKARPFTEVDCNTIVQSAIANLQLKIEKADADIKYISLPVVIADSSQLLQLFQNLIANAIKFRGEKRPELRITAESTGTEFIFSVRDNGIGFDQQYAEKIFDIFKRLHTQSKYPGSGIGLAICRRIVERHGGRIWAEGIPGKGATFYFTIPRKGAE